MATLKSLVDETTNIKNELVECYDNLKNNLTSKGAECSDGDKISNLINKIQELKVLTDIPISGDNYILYELPEQRANGSTKETKVCEYLHEGKDGTIKFSVELSTNGTSYTSYAILRRTRNGETTDIETLSYKGGLYTLCSCDVDILKDDLFSVWHKCSSTAGTAYIQNIKFSCSYVIL